MIINDCNKKEQKLSQLKTNATENPPEISICCPSTDRYAFSKPLPSGQPMRKQSTPTFIKKTWQMLQGQANWSIICWAQEGTSFKINNETLFTEILLPHYFKHSNLASFIRQLNMYNFHKRKTDRGQTVFYHRLFRKNHGELLIGIKRKPSEAEINMAEELIKRLAPECLEDYTTDAAKVDTHHEEEHDLSNKEAFSMGAYAEATPIWIFTPYFMPNLYQDYQWGCEPMMTNNIILQGIHPQAPENYNYHPQL